MNPNTKKQVFTWTIASLTLGLAPFTPEPHIVGKIRWVAGGAVGMTGMDWFDLVFHGFPWVFLGYWLVKSVMELVKTRSSSI
jgi:apolipoprotein N-acyltransferase